MGQTVAPPSATPWLHSRRGRVELAAFALFCLANLLIPLVITDLYPFSRAPMFADAPQRYCEYTATGSDGETLELAALGLDRNYWGNPLGVGVGYHPSPSADVFGDVPSQERIAAWVRERLRAFPTLSWVEVKQTVIGPIDSQRIGEMESNIWRVENPHFQGPRAP
jgi:hypothetical protein